jgi:hypothetical protein
MLDDILNAQSGLLGISGVSSDMRELDTGNPPPRQFTMDTLSTLNRPGFRNSGETESAKRCEFLNDQNRVASRGEEIAVAETRMILSSATLDRLGRA